MTDLRAQCVTHLRHQRREPFNSCDTTRDGGPQSFEACRALLPVRCGARADCSNLLDDALCLAQRRHLYCPSLADLVSEADHARRPEARLVKAAKALNA